MPSGDMTTEASQDHTMANANATTQAPDDRALQLEELINGSRPTLADPEPAARVRALADDEVETFYCGICMETKPVFDRFPCRGCAHRFCIACLVQYIQLRVAGSRVPVGCPEPGCTAGHLDREACKKLVDYDVYLAWGAVGGAITTPEAAYAGGVVDGGGAWDGRCAGCRRKQGGKEAVERREEEEEEGREAWTAELRELAAARGWRRCPECGVLIEKISGCNSMRCRCDCKFCYSCGLSLPRKKSTIRRSACVPRRRANERKEPLEHFEIMEPIQSLDEFLFPDNDAVMARSLMERQRRELRCILYPDEARRTEELEAGMIAKREAKIHARRIGQHQPPAPENDAGASSSGDPDVMTGF